jgi:hypothetical protein
MKVQLELKLADCWIGAFWKRDASILHIWLCVIPCIPLHIQILSKEKRVSTQQAIKQLAEKGYHLDPKAKDRAREEEGYTVLYAFARERRDTDLARCIHCYCYSLEDVYKLLDSLKGDNHLTRKNQIVWAIIGIILFLACYVEAMTLFRPS